MLAIVAVASLMGACTDRAPDALAPPAPHTVRLLSRADSNAAGMLLRSRAGGMTPGLRPLATLIGGGAQASVANVVPGWYQGAAQPQTISVYLNGPVNSVTVSGSGAILCSGTYGTLIGYDRNGTMLGSTPLALIDPSDCGSDDITFGAAATLTVTQGVIARFDITPMSPTTFQVAGRASAAFSVSLGVYAVADYPPIPAFSSSCNALSFDCTHDASASSDDFGISAYGWSLGKSPGGTASGATVTTNYYHTGWRTVTLSVTDNAGQTSQLTKDVGVGVGLPAGQPPRINLVITCSGLTCTFNDNAMGSTPALFRAWNFGDDTYFNIVAQPTHTYPATGWYYVEEKVADGTGVFSIAYNSLYVTGPLGSMRPVASFTWNCAGQQYPHQCAFDASGSTDDVGIVSYKWSWGNGRSETKVGPTTRNTWATSGLYPVSLTVTDTNGLTNVMIMYVNVP